jgi:hypothetical protein
MTASTSSISHNVSQIVMPRNTAFFQEDNIPFNYDYQRNILFSHMNNCHLLTDSTPLSSKFAQFLHQHACIHYRADRAVRIGDLFVVISANPSDIRRLERLPMSWEVLEACAVGVYQIINIIDALRTEGAWHGLLRAAPRNVLGAENTDEVFPTRIMIPAIQPAYMVYHPDAIPLTERTLPNPAIPMNNDLNQASTQENTSAGSTLHHPSRTGSSSAEDGSRSSLPDHSAFGRNRTFVNQPERDVISTPRHTTLVPPSRLNTASSDFSHTPSNSRLNGFDTFSGVSEQRGVHSVHCGPIALSQDLLDASQGPLEYKSTNKLYIDRAGNKLAFGGDSKVADLDGQSALRSFATVARLQNLLRSYPGNWADNLTVGNLCISADREWATINDISSTGGPHARIAFMSLVWYVQKERHSTIANAIMRFRFDRSREVESNSLRLAYFLGIETVAVHNKLEITNHSQLIQAWEGIAATYGGLYGIEYRQVFQRIASDLKETHLGVAYSTGFMETLSLDFLADLYTAAANMTAPLTLAGATIGMSPATMTPKDWEKVIWEEYMVRKPLVNALKHLDYQNNPRIFPPPHAAWTEIRAMCNPAILPARKPQEQRPANTNTIEKAIPAPKTTAKRAGPCVNSLQRQYSIKGVDNQIPACKKPCNFVHYDQLPATTKRSQLIRATTKVHQRFTQPQLDAMKIAIEKDTKFSS